MTLAYPSESRISVIIIAKNEAHDIGDCIDSVKGWVDEIVVLDSGSADGTQALCRERGAVVYETDWPGFGAQKNRALDKARCEWVLSLDADERVTPELRDEILSVLKRQPEQAAFLMPRSSWFCGRFMRHSGCWPDRVERLFRRERARFLDVPVHERIVVDGAVGQLEHPLIHYSMHTLGESLDKINQYSSVGARMMAERGKKSSVWKAVSHGLWAFVRTYFLQRGFLDGVQGFAFAVGRAEESYNRYMKLLLQNLNK